VQSIRAQGVLQPLIVRPRSDGSGYEIVAGERRWRAAQRVPLHEMPVVVREFSDGEALEIALIENVQRADLNALEEAQGYAQLIEHFGYTQQQLASSISKSRSHIANSLRLLSLPDEVKAHLETGALTAGHARTLVASAQPEELAREIIERG
jgi:ParB family transcriptional regulator, chromosome partitioning protein